MTLFITALLGVASLLSAATTKGVVRFHNQPVPGALVETATQKTTTDESGQWSLDLAPGVHTVRISMFGFQPKSIDISTTSNQVEVTLELLPKPETQPSARAGSFTEFVIQDATGELPADPPPPATDSASESFLLSGSLTIAGGIASTEVVTKTLLYYLHERAWSGIGWGRAQRDVDGHAPPAACAEAA